MRGVMGAKGSLTGTGAQQLAHVTSLDIRGETAQFSENLSVGYDRKLSEHTCIILLCTSGLSTAWGTCDKHIRIRTGPWFILQIQYLFSSCIKMLNK